MNRSLHCEYLPITHIQNLATEFSVSWSQCWMSWNTFEWPLKKTSLMIQNINTNWDRNFSYPKQVSNWEWFTISTPKLEKNTEWYVTFFKKAQGFWAAWSLENPIQLLFQITEGKLIISDAMSFYQWTIKELKWLSLFELVLHCVKLFLIIFWHNHFDQTDNNDQNVPDIHVNIPPMNNHNFCIDVSRWYDNTVPYFHLPNFSF